MFIDAFDWDDENKEHIGRHGVQDYEVEEVILFDRPVYLKGRGDAYYAYGVTGNGRYLFVVFASRGSTAIRVVTARDMMEKERAYYRKRI